MSKNWWEEYPATISNPERFSAEQVAELYSSPEESVGKTFLVVDVRRADYGGGHVKGSVNVPAQSFYDNRKEFVEKYSHIPKLYFYCNSSNGRGPRIAAWYQDTLNEMGITSSKGYVLAGGIKGWIEKFKGDESLIEGYDESWWKSEH
ncbi:hypothetical protein HK098_008281 [Nowakowskiella sp. JEL0407]|nr:hypothetical protein HK098_008281 [Nowakowskiella sp. JEL0407]